VLRGSIFQFAKPQFVIVRGIVKVFTKQIQGNFMLRKITLILSFRYTDC